MIITVIKATLIFLDLTRLLIYNPRRLIIMNSNGPMEKQHQLSYDKIVALLAMQACKCRKQLK